MDNENQYYYPEMGEQLGEYQPNLEYLRDSGEWVESGVIHYTMSEAFRGLYRVKISKIKNKEK